MQRRAFAIVQLCCITCALLSGCAAPPRAPVVLTAQHEHAVSRWHDIGAATVNVTAAAGSPAEQFPAFAADMATLQLAVYDALCAIDGRYQPFHFHPAGPTAGADPDAAVAAAAHGVLHALFPARADKYQAAYHSAVAAIPDGEAKRRGLELGEQAAAALVRLRANDGRATALPAYAATTLPGRYRGSKPINRNWPGMRPFTLQRMDQFRPPPPPALDSAAYAADFNEVKALGGKDSTVRTAAQLEIARFHTEAPATYLTRNFGRFARTTSSPVAAARLTALIYTGYADAIAACLEAKYHYDTWRPLSAIPLAETDDNPATAADPAWVPALTTPNHPEYPAAHSCTAGALGQLLRRYYGTDRVTYTFDSKATNTWRTFDGVDALAEESTLARIWSGMHFRYATVAGARLGRQVADWTMDHAFQEKR